LIKEELRAFVKKADDDAIRLKVIDHSLDAALTALGFVTGPGDDVLSRDVADDAEKARIFDALRPLGVAFSDGKEWCPAEVFEYLRDQGLLSGKFVRISWRQPGQFHLADV
jgi:hypothetical protein